MKLSALAATPATASLTLASAFSVGQEIVTKIGTQPGRVVGFVEPMATGSGRREYLVRLAHGAQFWCDPVHLVAA